MELFFEINSRKCGNIRQPRHRISIRTMSSDKYRVLKNIQEKEWDSPFPCGSPDDLENTGTKGKTL